MAHNSSQSTSHTARRSFLRWVFRSGGASMLLCLVGWFLVACGSPLIDKKDFCQGQSDCSAGETCLNAVCVTKTSEVGLPWDGVPSHHDAGEPVSDAVSPSCSDGQKRPCQGPGAACPGGIQTCLQGSWGDCSVPPQKEICNGKDDDCNGEIDEHFADKDRECAVEGQKGICAAGTWQCRRGSKICEARNTSTTEECNGKDDDCDGQVDNNIPNVGKLCKLEQLQGPCAEGRWTCTDKFITCRQTYEAKPEQCNGIDDDCDGQIDEGCQCKPGVTSDCYDGIKGCVGQGSFACQGSCRAGTRICSPLGRWGTCVGSVTPTTEVCDNKDNDCNGKIDDDLFKKCYTGPSHSLNHPPCAEGRQECSRGVWGRCEGETIPTDETCNGKDDNCNGQIDESLTRSCTSAQNNCKAQGVDANGQPIYRCSGECQAGTQSCSNGNWGVCKNETLPNKEICDNKDNDCNGQTDDQLQRPCGNNVGICQSGIETCQSGRWVGCTAVFPLPSDNPCNGVDDNCDGQIDESKGIEICDSIDNDCNGHTDESCGLFHDYAIVDGATNRFRGFSAALPVPVKAHYVLGPGATSASACPKAPLLITAQSGIPAAATYTCDPVNNNRYLVHTFVEKQGHTQLQPALLPFHAVVPSSGIYGHVACNHNSTQTRKCQITYSNQAGLTVDFADNTAVAIVKLKIAACSNTHQPIFATLFGDTPGYVRTFPQSSGLCEFQTFDANGVPTYRSFSFWIPPVSEPAWVALASNGQIADQASNHSTINSMGWKSRRVLNGTTYDRDEPSYGAWMSPSVVLLTPRFDSFSNTTPGFVATFLPGVLPADAPLRVYNHGKAGLSASHTRAIPTNGLFLRIIRVQ